jgi:hypothetical protein
MRRTIGKWSESSRRRGRLRQHARARALPGKKKPRHLKQVAGFWRRPIDSFAPAHSPAIRAGLTAYPPASRHGVFSARLGVPESEMPDEINSPGILFWRRPTLARPVAVLPSGLQRFTAVFGMGTGGTTALLSPECGAALAFRCLRSDANAKPNLWGRAASDTDALQFHFRKNMIFNPHSAIENPQSLLIL